MHLADSSFPTGGFAHSFGLEFAIDKKWVHDYHSLYSFTLDALEQTLVNTDALAVIKAAHVMQQKPDQGQAVKQLLYLNEELSSFRFSHESREASAQLGRSLLTMVGQVYSNPFYDYLNIFKNDENFIQQPLIWGVLAAQLELDATFIARTLLVATVRQWGQGALRIIPLGQVIVNRYIADVIGYMNTSLEMPGIDDSFSGINIGLDLAQAGHEKMAARYFRS